MYRAEPQLGADGKMYPIDALTRIDPGQGMLIYQLVRDTKPDNTLEIGLGYGFSTVYFLAAIRANGKGHHVAVDPYQINPWNGVGLTREKILGMEPGTFEFCSETSIQGLARFAREKRRFGTILIDGDHKFDYTLVDFSLASFVCETGGHIILDDMWMPAIQRVASFIRRNLPNFTEIPTPIRNIALFRMTSGEQRQWDYFVPF
jgi:cephalosporin hydroxylase